MDISTTVGIVNSADESNDFIKFEVRNVIQVINCVVLWGIISVLGVGTNIINISVFVKQGFKDTINISLTGLAISDLCSSITVFWSAVCIIPQLKYADVPFVFLDIMYVTGGWPHVCFNRVTSFITAFITLERCICIAVPLKVKAIITPFRTKAINSSIFIFTIILFSPFYFVNKLEWVFSSSWNRSILSLTFTSDKELVDAITYFIHSVFLSTALLLTVAICTIILIVKLNRKTQWRKMSALQTAKGHDNTFDKDKRVIKMVILIATIFIICYIPPTVSFIAMACFPDFSIFGRYQNTYVVIWSMTLMLEAVNSSVNIFVYFRMSSKFKATLSEMLSVRRQK